MINNIIINASKIPPPPTVNRELWTWGSGGILGLNDTTDRSSPVQVGTLIDWSKIDIGADYMLSIKTDGTLWSWGANTVGQLGLNDTTNRSSPVQVGTLNTWSTVAASISNVGDCTSLAIKTDGTLWGWGYNSIVLLDNSFTNISSPIQIGVATNWSSISVGNKTLYAIDTSNKLWAWGTNASGQVGDNTTTARTSPVQIGTLTNWKRISAGNSYVMAIKTDGTLWAWGNNLNGQLGLGDQTTRSSPVQVGTLTDWANVSCGASHTIAVKTDNSLWAWGGGGFGQHGLALPENTPIRIMPYDFRYKNFSAGGSHAMAIKNDGALWGWGTNSNGQLGRGNLTSTVSPVQIGALTTWKTVKCGHTHSLALLENGTLYATGINTLGQLGDLTTTRRSSPVQVLPTSKTNWVDMDAGLNFSMGLDSSGSIWTWGFNGNGELGQGDTTNRSSPVQVGALTDWSKISAANGGWYAIKTDGTLWSCGFGVWGALGDGSTTAKSSPVQIGSETNWQKVSGGSYFGLAIKGTGGTGSLWSWGRNSEGQLGLGDTTDRSSPVQIGTSTNWKEVFAAHDSGGASKGVSFAIKTDGTLWAWGYNGDSQLGDGTTVNKSSPVQIGTLSTWVSASGGFGFSLLMETTSSQTASIYSMGVNGSALGRFGLTNQTTLRSPVQLGTFSSTDYQWSTSSLRANANTSIIIKNNGSDSGSIWSFGRNFSGELGDGTTVDKSSPVQIGTLTTWVSASTGNASAGIRQY